MRLREVQFFVIGFVIGCVVVLFPFSFYKNGRSAAGKNVYNRIKPLEVQELELYDSLISNTLRYEVKILCMVMTHPENHRTKALHVKNTWGKRCNKLVFMSSEKDLLLDTVVLPFQESREILWNKTKASFKYLYDNHINEYDWFMKADDDNYIIIENLRFMLAHYNPHTALYFGHRYSALQLEEGYMAGGGYILSKKALIKFQEKIVDNKTLCHPDGWAEDLEMGRCLQHSVISVDCRDEAHQKRFFPVGVEEHMVKKVDPKYWYTVSQYYQVPQGSPDCCSSTSVEFHYINPHEMYALDYYIYNVHPFGIDDHIYETLPQKYPLKDIIAASDAKSPSPNFRKHKIYHNLEPSEIY